MIPRVNVIRCARCEGDHPSLAFARLDKPFAPPEAGGVIWSHWAPCPTNGQPILLANIDEKNPRDAKPGAEVGSKP